AVTQCYCTPLARVGAVDVKVIELPEHTCERDDQDRRRTDPQHGCGSKSREPGLTESDLVGMSERVLAAADEFGRGGVLAQHFPRPLSLAPGILIAGVGSHPGAYPRRGIGPGFSKSQPPANRLHERLGLLVLAHSCPHLFAR